MFVGIFKFVMLLGEMLFKYCIRVLIVLLWVEIIIFLLVLIEGVIVLF